MEQKIKFARPNYYQGILQLRDVDNEVVDFVRNQIDKRNDVLITKTVKAGNGIDMYITSQKFIRILGKKLKESFGGELKTSVKLHTKSRTGKDLYRVNVLFRPVKHKRGDIIVVRGDEVKLLAVGRRIFARDMKTGKKIKIRSSDLPKG
jgi:NMD protein affecting ribosome stability and mRNA decay